MLYIELYIYLLVSPRFPAQIKQFVGWILKPRLIFIRVRGGDSPINHRIRRSRKILLISRLISIPPWYNKAELDYHFYVYTLGSNAWLFVSNDCDMARRLVIWVAYLRDSKAIGGKKSVTRRSLFRNTEIVLRWKEGFWSLFSIIQRVHIIYVVVKMIVGLSEHILN